MVAVGRQHELDIITGFLAQVPAAGGALVLAGDAGIGKTVLWERAREHCGELGYRTLIARPAEVEASWPYVALADLIGDAVDEAYAELPAPQADALGGALYRKDPGRQIDHAAVATGLLGVLGLLARDQPVVVCVDDLQWLDDGSVRALSYALRRVQDSPVALVGTLRSPNRNPLAFGRPDDSADLRIGPLTSDELSAVLLEHLGEAVARPVVQRIHETTGGNPLYAVEVARALLRSGATIRPNQPLPLPEDHQHLFADRLADLTDVTRRLLLLVAAQSRPLTTEFAALFGDGFDAAHDEALGSGMLIDDSGRLRFSHPLLASATYQSAAPAARRDAHRTLAEASEGPERRARHLALAATTPDAAVATEIEYGARLTSMRGATLDAAALFERSAALTPTPDGGDDVAQHRLVEAAEQYRLAGSGERAERLLADAEATWPEGRARSLARLVLAQTRANQSPRVASDLFERAIAGLGEDPEWQAVAAVGRAWVALHTMEWEAAVVFAQAAVELAESHGSAMDTGLILATLAHARFLTGQGIDRSLIDRATAEAPGASRPAASPARGTPGEACGSVLKWAGYLDAARPLLLDARQQAEANGDEHAYAFTHYHLAELECFAGDWDAAARYAADGLDAVTVDGHAHAALRYVAALVDARRGDHDSARALAMEGVEIARAAGVATRIAQNTWVLGLVALSEGDALAAHDLLGPITTQARSLGIAEPGILRWVPDEIEALITLGQLDEAEAVLEWFEGLGQATERALALATAGRCRGLLEAARGNLDDGIAALETAERHHGNVVEPFERARTLLGLGTVRRRARQKSTARAALDEAGAILDALGAPAWLDKVGAERSRIGGRTAAPDELTPTEAQVAECVAAGRSNREAADLLHLSVKAVESNLTRVYRKLGVRSRIELAVRIGNRQPPDDPGARNQPGVVPG